MAVEIGSKYYEDLKFIRKEVRKVRAGKFQDGGFGLFFTGEQGRCFYDCCFDKSEASDLRLVMQWPKVDDPIGLKIHKARIYGFHRECVDALLMDDRF